MTENRNNHPLEPMEDQVLDRRLASLGRFAPSPGFADRVMARVRVPARLPTAARTPAVRRRRWPVLTGSLAGLAAASSTALTAWAALHFETLTLAAATMVTSVTVSIWHTALAWLAGASASMSSALLTTFLTAGVARWISTIAVLNLAVPVSMIGLLLTARPYLRKTTHAVR